MNSESRDKVFARDLYRCVICGEHIQRYNSCQIAHHVKSGKGSELHIMAYLWSKYKKDRSRAWVNKYILDNEMNLSSVCSLKCNDACNIFFKPIERDALIDKIIETTKCLEIMPDK
jgi:hypothetical protein